jgi:hypothetical protein
MTSPSLSWMSGLAAVLAGGTFIFAELLTPIVAVEGFREATLSVSVVASSNAFFLQSLLTWFAGALLLVALFGLYARQSEGAGKLGVIGFLFAFFGTVLITGDFYANTFVTPLVDLGHPELLDSPYSGVLQFWLPLEFGFLTLGWILFAVATLRARIYPRGASWLLLAGAVVALLPLPYVNIIFDAAVVWLGITLMKQSASAAPSRRHLQHI